MFVAAQGGAGICEYEFAEFHAAHGKHAVCDFADFVSAAFHDDDFKAVVVIEVNMRRGQDDCAAMMLNLGEFLREVGYMMVVDEGECAYDGLVGVDRLGEQGLTDEVADSFRTVAIASFADEAVKLFQQIVFEGYAGAAYLGHRHSLYRF